ncbi:MAG: Ribosomal large subunit pseudouridine synthase [Firmicutes bacterium]|nr:Ribosomal large subunit pseudouridine synthase [Bacillota bacterium]
MKAFTIQKNDAGQRLDRWLSKNLPLLPPPLAQKYIRLKRVKLNGKGAKRDTHLNAGDLLELYINDEFFDLPTPENAFLSISKPQLDILYEDENLLLVDKRPGMVVHPDETERVNTLITHIQAYLYQKREWSPYTERSFAPALCHRIDRNTGGIVIAAKTAEALRIINEKIRDREIEKYYLCIIHGAISPPQGTLRHILLKDEGKKQVSVHHHAVPGGRSAATEYHTLARNDNLSLMECRLITGRTHQIRAQFAAAGHPLLGDGKYGKERDNKPFGRTYQALYSYRLQFTFPTDAGVLSYLKGKTVSVPKVDFAEEFFPEFSYVP